jgi:hypothetical protein
MPYGCVARRLVDAIFELTPISYSVVDEFETRGELEPRAVTRSRDHPGTEEPLSP